MISTVFFINLVSILLILLSIAISLFKNSDLFSPVKLYALFSLFFYFDIFFGGYNIYVCLLYLLQNSLLPIFSLLEPRVNIKRISVRPALNIDTKRAIIIVWLLSIGPIVNQIMLINNLGGIVETIGNIAYRVKYFEGKGYLLIINSFFIILNAIYFLSVMKKPRPLSLILYLVHFFILIGFGLLSGSRSFIVMTILVLLILYNYSYKAIGFKFALIGFILMVSFVGILGGLRNSVSANDGQLSINKSSLYSLMESSHFKYGLIPLDIITTSSLKDLKFGETYLSLLTNFVPRKIYPDKPETGGIFFTKAYAGNQWNGYSNLATGAMTEGIINFGFPVGVVAGLIGIILYYFLGIKMYSFLLFKMSQGKSYFIIIPYIYFVLLAARYSYSEFSYINFSFFTTIIFPNIIFWFFYRLTFKSLK